MPARTGAWAALALACTLACTTPCREVENESDLREFERDHERCERQARRLIGTVDPGDYRACMRARGWCSAPDWD
jgi:hypothetical protein